MFLIDQQGNSCRVCARVTALGKWRRRQEWGGRLKMWGVVVLVVVVGGLFWDKRAPNPPPRRLNSPRRGLTRRNYLSQLSQPAKRSWQRWGGWSGWGGGGGRSRRPLWNWIFNQSYKYRLFFFFFCSMNMNTCTKPNSRWMPQGTYISHFARICSGNRYELRSVQFSSFL